jgi:hypothetical protein
MIERTEEGFGLKPERLVGDTAYEAAPMLNWLVEEKGIAPHIPVFDKSKRDDGTFSRGDFRYDQVFGLLIQCGLSRRSHKTSSRASGRQTDPPTLPNRRSRTSANTPWKDFTLGNARGDNRQCGSGSES